MPDEQGLSQETLEEHSKKEKEVLAFFRQVMHEINNILITNSEGKDLISPRIQMVSIFSVVDMLASYWFEYKGLQGKTNERPMIWYDEFCAREDNSYWRHSWTILKSKRLYDFRNSLVHFFGMGSIDTELSIVLATNNITDLEKNDLESSLRQQGYNAMVIRPKDFYALVKEGSKIMLHCWMNSIKESSHNPAARTEYISGIQRVWLKIENEGAVAVPREWRKYSERQD